MSNHEKYKSQIRCLKLIIHRDMCKLTLKHENSSYQLTFLAQRKEQMRRTPCNRFIFGILWLEYPENEIIL